MVPWCTPTLRAPVISFIIPAHNEEVLLPQALARLQESAARSGYPFEVLVIDDASTDRTGALAEEHGARVVRVGHRHIAATRNAGAREARGSTLVFVDADTWVSLPLLMGAMGEMERGASGGGAAIRLYGRPTRHERAVVRVLCWAFRWTKIAPGCFLFCTREAFERVGGFDETMFAAEDVAISHALSRQGRFVILREHAYTSDRKMRTHGVKDHLRLLVRFFRRGRAVLRDRDDLGLWYGARRHS